MRPPPNFSGVAVFVVLMLTRATLTIGPWQIDASSGCAASVRAVRDPASRATLGIVCLTARERMPWWRFWSPANVLEVCETEDRALIMSVQPSRIKKGTWVVRDCDGNEVGKLLGDELLDPWSRCFARREKSAAGTWALRELDGRNYAACATSANGDATIEFLDPVLTNPFLRMLVIGSFLLLQPRPERQVLR